MDIIDGVYVKAGKKKLYMKATGSGAPPVIIETGWGSLSAEWSMLQEELSKITTVITYDRAGYGESAPGEQPRDSERITDEMKEMLTNAGVKPPYILLGHSSGGLYVQHYAKKFPDDTGGLILVDPFTPETGKLDELDAPKFQEALSNKVRAENIRKYTEMSDEDLEKFVSQFLNNMFTEFPEDIRNQLIVYQTDKNLYKAIVDEFDAMEDSYMQCDEAGDLPKVPLRIIGRDPNVMQALTVQLGIPSNEANLVEDEWQKQMKGLTKLSPESKFLTAEGSNHSIHLSRPEIIRDEVANMVQNFGSFFELG